MSDFFTAKCANSHALYFELSHILHLILCLYGCAFRFTLTLSSKSEKAFINITKCSHHRVTCLHIRDPKIVRNCSLIRNQKKLQQRVVQNIMALIKKLLSFKKDHLGKKEQLNKSTVTEDDSTLYAANRSNTSNTSSNTTLSSGPTTDASIDATSIKTRPDELIHVLDMWHMISINLPNIPTTTNTRLTTKNTLTCKCHSTVHSASSVEGCLLRRTNCSLIQKSSLLTAAASDPNMSASSESLDTLSCSSSLSNVEGVTLNVVPVKL